MKKLATLFLIISSIFICTNASAAMILEYDGSVHNYTGSTYSLLVNGKELKDLPLQPIIFNDRAVVPVREVFEALGATVNYEANTQKITIKYEKSKVEIQIDSNSATVDGNKNKIPDGLTPKLIAKWGESAKTMVPLRFISESVGIKISFDAEKGQISVTGKNTASTNTNTSTTTTTTTTTTQNVINKVVTKEEDDVVTVTVTAKNNVSKISDAVVTSSGVLYIDVPNMTYTVPNKTTVSEDGAVLSVRMGAHETSTRIAIDTKEMKKHSVAISGKNIIFKITKSQTADVTQKPAEKPTNQTTSASENIEQNENGVTYINGKSPMELSGGIKYVVLDAGHGGSDPGAIGNLMTDEELEAYHEALASPDPIIATMEAGTAGKINEKDIALKVTKKVKEKLEAQGIKVILTRSGDTYPTLDERPALANNKGAAMFLSIHLNATVNPVTGASGMEIYYTESNNGSAYGVTSKSMATTILKAATSATKAQSRGVMTGNLLVTRKSVMPANLIEIGFLNNPDELIKLNSDSYQEKIATGIAKGIAEVYGKIKLPE